MTVSRNKKQNVSRHQEQGEKPRSAHSHAKTQSEMNSLAFDNAERMLYDAPAAIHSTNRSMRQAEIIDLQDTLGNSIVQNKLIARSNAVPVPTRRGRLNRNPLGRAPQNHTFVQRGEAPVHEEIENSATEGSEERSVNEMYAGNWMRDFSQLNLPTGHNIVSQLPKRVDEPMGEKIGAAGAEDIITSVIRALAYMHFGADITNELVTPENIGRYTPEQHIDNPMGTTATDHLVRDSHTQLLREGRPQFRIEDANTAPYETFVPDQERDTELAGKAFPGLQTENPELYKVSAAGLSNHIYNGSEWVKEQLSQAISSQMTPQGRMHLGSALHGIEDYFAHSNFIEVALNSEIGRAVTAMDAQKETTYSTEFLRNAQQNRASTGAYVDTMYNAATPDGRMAVTTGTAGSEDLKVSVGQIILPKLPALSGMINKKIDEALNLVVESDGKSSWEQIQEQLKSDEGGLAALEVINALDKHIEVPVHNAWLTGHDIPFTDKFIPTGFETSQSSAGIVAAIRHYIRLYERVNLRLDEFETAINVLFPLTMLIDLKKQFMKLFHGFIAELKKDIQQRINEFLLTLVEELTGMDLKEKKKMGLEHALNFASTEGIEHLRSGTSIESRLDEINNEPSNDVATLWYGYGIQDGQPQFNLPPSHSEVSKDHPPHSEEHNVHPPHEGNPNEQNSTEKKDKKAQEHNIAEGSPFYHLHRELAIEADKHIIAQLQEIWDEQEQMNSVDSLNASPSLNSSEVMEQARNQQAREQERAAEEGRTSATHESQRPGSGDLMALVDLFIAHPDDTTWWQSIVSSYVNKNEQQVIRHIRLRNTTREQRTD